MSERVCAHCKNYVYDEEALLCHFCGESLGCLSDGVLGKMRGTGIRWLWVAGVVFLMGVIVLQLF